MTLSDFDQSGVGVENVSSLKSDDHLTAFGLALMQNGFHTPNSILNSQTFQQINKQNHTNSVSSTNLSSSSGNVNSALGQNNGSSGTISQKSTQIANELIWNSKSENYQHSQKQFKYNIFVYASKTHN